ncbi:short-chain dehydrogenase/reductase 3-like [Mytilus edulis]|uniref:short-chain dehydrogenase/reductase 3-like n=1 Tax=Mytilus edulis TaxID=6550 RepID=UPI0039EEC79B
MESDSSYVLWECCRFIFLSVYTVFKVFYYVFKTLILKISPRNERSVADDVILITGGGRGIGRQMALQFSRLKPKHIILWGRKEEPLQKTTEDVQNLGVSCSYFVCDVCDRELVYKTGEEIKNSIGDVTILVNNAGIFNGALVLNDTEENIQKTFAINALAHIWAYKAFLPGMISQGRGHIVTISSMLGIMSLRGASSYCGSKFMTTGISEALHLELEEYPNIHLTSVHSYQVQNDMFQDLKLRFPWLIPPLSEDYVAKATVRAVLCNEKIIMMPRIMYLLVPCLSIFPAWAMAPLFRFLGVDSALESVLAQKQKTE